MLIFAAGSQGYFLVRSRWYENLLLLLVAFTLFRPGFWMDIVHDPYRDIPPAQLAQALGDVADGSQLRLRIKGEDAVGDAREFSLLLPVPEGATGEERLEKLGLLTYEEGGKVLVDSVTFGRSRPGVRSGNPQGARANGSLDQGADVDSWLPGVRPGGLVAASPAGQRCGLSRA
jgi:hypothetical protein